MVCVKFVPLVLAQRMVILVKRRIDMKFVTCPGSRLHIHYTPTFDGHHLTLVESGISDVQDTIEAYGRYTDLHFMLHRLSVGDSSVVSSRPPIYGDFSGLPNNPIDVINLMRSAESDFAGLSREERSSYNNDFRAWLTARLSGDQNCNPAASGSSVSTEPVKTDKEVIA